jgi:hypothetical protein
MREIKDIIRAKEDQRIEALLASNIAALDQAMSDDLIHIHANGSVETKEQYLKGVAERLEFLSIERPDFDVHQLAEDVAVSVGPMLQVVRLRTATDTVTMKAMVTQVWTRENGDWRSARFQATLIKS